MVASPDGGWLLTGEPEEKAAIGRIRLRGTVVCGVVDSEEARGAIAVAVELCQRLGLRLVLAHVSEGTEKVDSPREAALLARLAEEHGVAETAERRAAQGDVAARLAQIAAEEAADLILVGAHAEGRLRGRLESRLVKELRTATSIPVLIAPPRPRFSTGSL